MENGELLARNKLCKLESRMLSSIWLLTIKKIRIPNYLIWNRLCVAKEASVVGELPQVQEIKMEKVESICQNMHIRL